MHICSDGVFRWLNKFGGADLSSRPRAPLSNDWSMENVRAVMKKLYTKWFNFNFLLDIKSVKVFNSFTFLLIFKVIFLSWSYIHYIYTYTKISQFEKNNRSKTRTFAFALRKEARRNRWKNSLV